MSSPTGEPEDGEEVQLTAEVHVQGRDMYLTGGETLLWAHHIEPSAAAAECPYPGLVPFGPEHAQWFFGRDRSVAELTVQLDRRLRTGGPLVVLAASGAGKSSLLRAGLLPAIARGVLPALGSSQWPSLLFTPTAHPVTALAAQLAALTGAGRDEVAAVLAAGPEACAGMVRTALREQAGDGSEAGARLVVVVDQLEELFTLCTSERERRDFLELISRLAEAGPDGDGPPALVVYGLRSDFHGFCADHPHLRTALREGHVLLGPMAESGLREAILLPAQAVGLGVEPGLVELLLRDLGVRSTGDPTSEADDVAGTGAYEAGRLPLLAHALRATWQHRSGNTLTVEGYLATGGIHSALAATAEQIFETLAPDARRTARRIFLRLVKIGEDIHDTRRRVPRADLLLGSDADSGAAATVVEVFTRGRLLTHDRGTVEITHEALLSTWPRLRAWTETDRAGQLTRQELEEAAARWELTRDPGTLYRGVRLKVARDWAGTHGEDEAGPKVLGFLAESVRQDRSVVRLLDHTVAALGGRRGAGGTFLPFLAALLVAGVLWLTLRALPAGGEWWTVVLGVLWPAVAVPLAMTAPRRARPPSSGYVPHLQPDVRRRPSEFEERLAQAYRRLGPPPEAGAAARGGPRDGDDGPGGAHW